jgi:hypothetical protein
MGESHRYAFKALGCRLWLLLALGLFAMHSWAEEAGLKLATAVHERPNGRDLTTVSRMALTEKGRQPRLRELVAYRLEKGRGEASHLIRFIEPVDIAGTGLLGIDRADGSNEQWLYLPELDRVRRIAGDRKGGRFVGSDLYFEDLQERKPAQDRHRLLGRETVNGVACEMLESVPVDAGNSVYRRRVSWVDPATALVHRVDYFEKDEAAPAKRWLLLAARQVQGYWTVTDSRMINLATGHETRMTVEAAIYDRKLPARLFTSQALADENIESEFRP